MVYRIIVFEAGCARCVVALDSILIASTTSTQWASKLAQQSGVLSRLQWGQYVKWCWLNGFDYTHYENIRGTYHPFVDVSESPFFSQGVAENSEYICSKTASASISFVGYSVPHAKESGATWCFVVSQRESVRLGCSSSLKRLRSDALSRFIAWVSTSYNPMNMCNNVA